VKEKIEKVKKFCHDHREVILFAVGGTMGAVVSSYVATKAMQKELTIDHVEANWEKHKIRVIFKNGDIEYYNRTTPN
jgi:hypothetical protein